MATDNRSPEQQSIATTLPFAFANRFGLLAEPASSGDGPLNREPLQLYSRGTPEAGALLEARRYLGRSFQLQCLPPEQFEQALARFYQGDASEARQLMEDLGSEAGFHTLADALPETEDILESDDDAPIIRLLNAMFGEAIQAGASDIHIETFEHSLVIRFRIDGVLREILRPNRKLATLLVSRVKVMSRLDIAEKRLPQDGRIALRLAGRAVDVRVSTMPSAHGERVVMRLLDKQKGRLELSDLGMTETHCQQFAQMVNKPHGIILVTGPTGSGKTTTLYAALSAIDSSERNILTVEDPIEYLLDGVGQTQVNSKVEMTFARGLRAILRQDPDVVMIGEIRDPETVQIAVQASLTGHLVLSTVHTNSAASTVTRLRDMGVEPFLLSSSLLGVLAQRLVRRLCPSCKQPYQADVRERGLIGQSGPVTLHRACGCPECNHSGYRGRTGIHELLMVDDTVRQMIHQGSGEQEIERYARRQSPGIRGDGLEKVLRGETSLEEVLRVTREE